MTKQIKYPMEAFALAMVLFSAGMKEAMIVGIGLIFSDVLQCVLREFSNKQYGQTISGIGAALTCGVIYVMCTLAGIIPELKQVVGFAVLGLLLVKHNETKYGAEQAETDYNAILFADAIAYGVYVLFAAIREYLAGAAVFGYELAEAPVVSTAFGKPMIALVGAGLAVALINGLLKTKSEPNAALWVCVPAILLEVPFVWNHVPELAGMAVGVVTVGVVYLTLRKKLAFADTDNHLEGIPVEMVMLGIVYMIFSLL
ncbi:MAG: hypothetical protein PHP50_13680 [Lachnospiraceae bacterium]|nr:hypothetical protein [Lachnospiraceae bacterium]